MDGAQNSTPGYGSGTETGAEVAEDAGGSQDEQEEALDPTDEQGWEVWKVPRPFQSPGYGFGKPPLIHSEGAATGAFTREELDRDFPHLLPMYLDDHEDGMKISLPQLFVVDADAVDVIEDSLPGSALHSWAGDHPLACSTFGLKKLSQRSNMESKGLQFTYKELNYYIRNYENRLLDTCSIAAQKAFHDLAEAHVKWTAMDEWQVVFVTGNKDFASLFTSYNTRVSIYSALGFARAKMPTRVMLVENSEHAPQPVEFEW